MSAVAERKVSSKHAADKLVLNAKIEVLEENNKRLAKALQDILTDWEVSRDIRLAIAVAKGVLDDHYQLVANLEKKP